MQCLPVYPQNSKIFYTCPTPNFFTLNAYFELFVMQACTACVSSICTTHHFYTVWSMNIIIRTVPCGFITVPGPTP